MAATAGYGGSVTFAGLTAGVKGWNIDRAIDMLDSSGFDGGQDRTHVGGPKGWTCTATVNWDSANTIAIDDSGTITLQYTAGETISGSVIVSNISDSVEYEGLVESTVSFQGTGSQPS